MAAGEPTPAGAAAPGQTTEGAPSARSALRCIGLGAALGLLGAIVGWAALSALRADSRDIARASLNHLAGSDQPGVLFVEAPQVFTRERLVNDRFSEAQWLNAELERTKRDSEDDRFAAAASRTLRRLWARAGTASGGGGAEQAADAPEDPAALSLDPLDVLDRRLAHRNRLRTELMDAQLDDGHDLDENTLYRLNFDVTALPFRGSEGRPTALFLFTVTKPDANADADEKANAAATGTSAGPENDSSEMAHALRRANDDDLALQRDLRAEMEALLADAVEHRTEQLARTARIENPANVGEPAFFTRMLQHELEARFVELVVDAADLSGCKAELIPKRCADFGVKLADGEATVDRAVARPLVRAAMGLPDRSVDPDAPLPPPLQAQFERARAAAEAGTAALHDASRALNAGCAIGASDEARPPREVCDPLPPDPSGQRAMLRLVAVMEAMRSALRPSDQWCVGAAAPGPCTSGAQDAAMDGDGVALGVRAFVKDFATQIPTPESLTKALAAFLSGAGLSVAPPPVGGPSPAEAPPAGLLERFIEKMGRGPAVCREGTPAGSTLASKLDDLFLCPPPPGLRGQLAAMLVERRLTDPRGDGNPLRRFFSVERRDCGHAPCRIALGTLGADQLEPSDRLALGEACGNASGAGGASAALCSGLQPEPSGDGAKGLSDAEGDAAQAPSPAQSRCARAAVVATASAQPAMRGQSPSSVLAERYSACALRAWLDDRTTDMTVYGLAPRTQGAVRDVDRSLDVALQAAAYGVTAAAGAARSETARRSAPYLIGFSDVVADQPSQGPRDRAAFGWALLAEDGDAPRAQRLSAILSVPSWWSRVDVRVEACWVDAAQVRRRIAQVDRERLFKEVCDDDLHDIDRTFRLNLPRRAVEVASRFHLDVIRTPYFDLEWQRDLQKRPNMDLAVEAGRDGALVLVGERLWRSTVVSLGGQIADRVEVLPDMRGIVAHFACVQPVARNEASLFVWTAEGKAGPLVVRVEPWRPKDRFDSPPCYGAKTHRVEPKSGLEGAALVDEMEQISDPPSNMLPDRAPKRSEGGEAAAPGPGASAGGGAGVGPGP